MYVMQAFVCHVCGYLYDDETADKNVEGVGIPFPELDPEWTCPVCGVGADMFLPFDSNRPPDLPTK
jgi:rubredoxin